MSDEVEVTAPQSEEGASPAGGSHFGSESHSVSHSSGSPSSSSNADSSVDIHLPHRVEPDPNATKPNRWCVEGQHKIYSDAKVVNEDQKMARIITKELQVLTGSLHTVPIIEELFKRHKCE